MALIPPQDYRKTEFTHRAGLQSAKPAATDVLPGTLYFSTDLGTIERSDGATWTRFGGSTSGPPMGPPGMDGIDGEDGIEPFFIPPPPPLTLYGCAAYNAATQSIPDNAFTAVTFDSEEFDRGDFHSPSTNPSRFTVPPEGSGVYIFSTTISFATHATGQRIIKIQKNGAELNGNGYITPSSSGVYITGLSFSIITVLSPGDYLEAVVYQNTGGNLNIGHATVPYIMNRAQIARIGRTI